ncbi:MAG: ABC transporter permease [Rubellimicrobium sp.]|nr:ABC transporter permease [Rubellimicrobium sp.]
MNRLPNWADVILIPLISIVLAMILSGAVIAAIGQNPVTALRIMVAGAFGTSNNFGYTLYYATNFIFTGLAVSIAFHARLFNIGAEGQAGLGGLGVALVCLYLPWPHWSLALVAAILAAFAFGAAWAAIPAYLQVRRGSHIVITTIMFNAIAAALLNYLLVNIINLKGSMDPATARFPDSTHLPSLADMLRPLGIPFSTTAPANIALLLAILAAFLVWVLIWRTRLGYELRAFGHSESAARYAGINAFRITMIVMLASGGLAGLLAINKVMGEAERLVVGAVEGAGFIGIAVALMGRNHPLGVILAALLFGALTQGGQILSQNQTTSIPVELVIVIQALVIMFTGALDEMVRAPLVRLFRSLRDRSAAQSPGQNPGQNPAWKG